MRAVRFATVLVAILAVSVAGTEVTKFWLEEEGCAGSPSAIQVFFTGDCTDSGCSEGDITYAQKSIDCISGDFDLSSTGADYLIFKNFDETFENCEGDLLQYFAYNTETCYDMGENQYGYYFCDGNTAAYKTCTDAACTDCPDVLQSYELNECDAELNMVYECFIQSPPPPPTLVIRTWFHEEECGGIPDQIYLGYNYTTCANATCYPNQDHHASNECIQDEFDFGSAGAEYLLAHLLEPACYGEPVGVQAFRTGACLTRSSGQYVKYTCDGPVIEELVCVDAACTNCAVNVTGSAGDCIHGAVLECSNPSPPPPTPPTTLVFREWFHEDECGGIPDQIYLEYNYTTCVNFSCYPYQDHHGSNECIQNEFDFGSTGAEFLIANLLEPPCIGTPVGLMAYRTGACIPHSSGQYVKYTCDGPVIEELVCVDAACTNCAVNVTGSVGDCIYNSLMECYPATPVPTSAPTQAPTQAPCLDPISISFDPPRQDTATGLAVSLGPTIRKPPCFVGTYSVVYEIEPPVPAITSLLAAGGLTIKIPPTALAATSYNVTATLTYGQTSHTAVQTLVVFEQPPRIVLKNQATDRLVAVDVVNTIDATGSVNPNPGGSPVICAWSCQTDSGFCPSVNFSTCLLTFASGTLPTNATMLLTLTATAATATSNITIVYHTVPTLSAAVSLSVPGRSASGYLNGGKTIRILGEVTFAAVTPPVAQLRWSSIAVQGGHVLDMANSSYFLGGTSSFNLAIQPNVLLVGTYTFRLTVNSTYGLSYSQIEINVNGPPTAGNFSVTPTLGRSLTDRHVLTIDGSVGSPNEMLSYQFAYSTAGVGGVTYLYSVPNPASQFTISNLPAGNHTMFAIVYNSVGSWSQSSSVMVQVLPPLSTNVTKIIADEVDTAVAAQDPAAILQAVRLVASMLETTTDAALARLALVDAIAIATELTDLTPDTAYSLVQSLKLIASDASAIDVTLLPHLQELLSTLAHVSSSASADFISVASTLISFRNANNATASNESTAQLQETLTAALFSILDDVSCEEPPSVIETAELTLVGLFASSFAGREFASGGVQVTFGDGFRVSGDMAAFNQSACTQMHQVTQQGNPYVFQRNASFVPASSSMALSLYTAAGAQFSVSDLSSNQSFIFDFTFEAGVNASALSCIFWNDTSFDWDTSGCTVESISSTSISCRCSHLTTFTIGSVFVSLNIIDPVKDIDSLQNLARTRGGLFTIAVVGSLLALYFGLLFFTIIADRRDSRTDMAPLLADLGEFVNKYCETYQRTLDETIMETRCLEEWRRIYKMNRFSPKNRPSFWRRTVAHVAFGLRVHHAWVSIFFRPLDRYTRTARLTVAFAILFSSMAANALFYQFGADDFSLINLFRQFVVAALSTLIVFIPTTGMSLLFERIRRRNETDTRSVKDITVLHIMEMNLKNENYLNRHSRATKALFYWTMPWWMAIPLYIIILTGSAMCIYVTLLYGSTFNDEQATEWIESFLLSVALSIVVVQTAKAFLGTALAAMTGSIGHAVGIGADIMQMH